MDADDEDGAGMAPTGRATARDPDPGLTEPAAAKFVERHGRSGLVILEQRAELADELGHRVAARTWRKMADAAGRLLRAEHPHAPPGARPSPPAQRPVWHHRRISRSR